MSLLTSCKLLNVFVVLSASLAVNIKIDPATAEEYSIAPDGVIIYSCGVEKNSHIGCFDTWVRVTKQGKDGPWQPASCKEGLCFQGGVAWWYWRGKEAIGAPVLTDFWVRDYDKTLNGGKSNENPYGDAVRINGEIPCYSVKQNIYCMKQMRELRP